MRQEFTFLKTMFSMNHRNVCKQINKSIFNIGKIAPSKYLDHSLRFKNIIKYKRDLNFIVNLRRMGLLIKIMNSLTYTGRLIARLKKLQPAQTLNETYIAMSWIFFCSWGIIHNSSERGYSSAKSLSLFLCYE